MTSRILNVKKKIFFLKKKICFTERGWQLPRRFSRVWVPKQPTGHVYWRAPCLVKPLTLYFFLILHPPQQYPTPEPLSAASLRDGFRSMTQHAGPFQTFLPWQNLLWFDWHRIHILLSLPDSGSWVPWTKVTFEATNDLSSNSSSPSLLILPSFSWNLLKLFNAHEWKLFARGARTASISSLTRNLSTCPFLFSLCILLQSAD